jgi:hypothetical protein
MTTADQIKPSAISCPACNRRCTIHVDERHGEGEDDDGGDHDGCRSHDHDNRGGGGHNDGDGDAVALNAPTATMSMATATAKFAAIIEYLRNMKMATTALLLPGPLETVAQLLLVPGQEQQVHIQKLEQTVSCGHPTHPNMFEAE